MFPSFLKLFLVLFWMLKMLVTMIKPSHVPHASRITTSGTIFTETSFIVSNEYVRSSSHFSLITNVKTLAKQLSAVRPKTLTRRRSRRRKTRSLWWLKRMHAEPHPLNEPLISQGHVIKESCDIIVRSPSRKSLFFQVWLPRALL